MKSKKIANIVFYKYLEGGRTVTKACIFYKDGSVLDTNYETGIDACEEIVKERKITTRNAFQEMINKDIVHVMSGTEFEKSFQKFISHEVITHEVIRETIRDKVDQIETPIKEEKVEKESVKPVMAAATAGVAAGLAVNASKEEKKEEEKDEKESNEEASFEDGYEIDSNESTPEMVEVEKEEPKKEGFFKRTWRKIKESKLGVRLTAIGIAVLMACGLYSCAKKNTLSGAMYRSNLTTSSDKLLNDEENHYTLNAFPIEKERTSTKENTVGVTQEEKQETTIYDEATNSVLILGNNEYYDNYSYEQLQAVTQHKVQKQAMKNLHDALYGFNETFADAYVEPGKDIRAALTFDEVSALQQAYNDYKKADIRAIFNGTELDAAQMTRDYKSATLQLMGAHIIENKDHPVDMSVLLETEEGKEFYNRYHKMFLDAKTATGKDKLEKVKEFYQAVRKDFPITDEVRTEGIAHADAYASLESYKLSVVPMISAAEMMFQNLKVDYTLNDKEVNFLNDVGLCNVANNKFEKIQAIVYACCTSDKTNPLYEQYRDAMIRYLKERNHYVIDDEHRELSKLDSFQKALEVEHQTTGEYWSYVGGYNETTETHTETKTWTETETTTWTEVTVTEAPIPEEEKEKIDAEIEGENEEARRQAEEEAERVRQALQEEADRQAEEVIREVEEDAQDMQERIEDANEQIELNQDDNPENDKPVNEEDFGDHNVDFYPEYEDGNGNLEDFVEHITTDPTGDQTGEPLPDPNETGAAFDANSRSYEAPSTYVEESEPVFQEYEIPAVEYVSEGAYIEYPTFTETEEETETYSEEGKTETTVQAREEEQPVFQEYEMPVVEQVSEEAYIEYPSETVPEQKPETPSEEVKTESMVQAREEEQPVFQEYEIPTVEYVSEDAYIEYPTFEESVPTTEENVESASVPTNEEIVDSYVESLATDTSVEEDSYEYSK